MERGVAHRSGKRGVQREVRRQGSSSPYTLMVKHFEPADDICNTSRPQYFTYSLTYMLWLTDKWTQRMHRFNSITVQVSQSNCRRWWEKSPSPFIGLTRIITSRLCKPRCWRFQYLPQLRMAPCSISYPKATGRSESVSWKNHVFKNPESKLTNWSLLYPALPQHQCSADCPYLIHYHHLGLARSLPSIGKGC
jgi:hypothetical protein